MRDTVSKPKEKHPRLSSDFLTRMHSHVRAQMRQEGRRGRKKKKCSVLTNLVTESAHVVEAQSRRHPAPPPTFKRQKLLPSHCWCPQGVWKGRATTAAVL